MIDLDAYYFWQRFDEERVRKNLTINQVAEQIGMKAQTIREQRSNNALPKTADLYNMAMLLNVSMEFLLTGHRPLEYDARVIAIANSLAANPDKLDAVEILLFGEKAGASSKFS